jgi:hypothetical protein
LSVVDELADARPLLVRPREAHAAECITRQRTDCDKAGQFKFTKSTFTGNSTVLINESGNFEVVF